MATKNNVQTETVEQKAEAKKRRGEGHTITIDFGEYPELLAEIRAAAKKDDREPSKWLRRKIVELSSTYLFAE